MKKAPKAEKTCSVSKGLVLFYSYWILDDSYCGNNALLWLVPKSWKLSKRVYSPSVPFLCAAPGGRGGGVVSDNVLT